MSGQRRGLLRRLYDLDHRALNSWWGVLVVPFPWLAYRLGRLTGGDRENVGAYLVGGPGYGSLFNRGRAEGEPLRRR
ncbi:MAG TPA: hypothetical protein VFQ85_19345 [Mycobacteriales bacterium]|nr:hypothetical protein [Mycobacteriales bacterium]